MKPTLSGEATSGRTPWVKSKLLLSLGLQGAKKKKKKVIDSFLLTCGFTVLIFYCFCFSVYFIGLIHVSYYN